MKDKVLIKLHVNLVMLATIRPLKEMTAHHVPIIVFLEPLAQLNVPLVILVPNQIVIILNVLRVLVMKLEQVEHVPLVNLVLNQI